MEMVDKNITDSASFAVFLIVFMPTTMTNMATDTIYIGLASPAPAFLKGYCPQRCLKCQK